MSQSDFLKVAIEAVKRAEEVILAHFKPNIEVSLKDDKTPVTIADTEAEKIIISTIRQAFPTHDFLGEESGIRVPKSDYLWIIDPIDGTKNYIRGIPLFTTEIALMEKGKLVLGVSNAPALKDLMYAQKGQGAYSNDKPVHVSSRDLKDSYMSFGDLTKFQQNNELEALLRIDQEIQGSRGFGDCWSYHLLAQGKIDIMIEHPKIWDIAAVSVIVEEAGGKVTDFKGQPVNLNITSSLATNGKLHEAILAYLNNQSGK